MLCESFNGFISAITKPVFSLPGVDMLTHSNKNSIKIVIYKCAGIDSAIACHARKNLTTIYMHEQLSLLVKKADKTSFLTGLLVKKKLSILLSVHKCIYNMRNLLLSSEE